MTNMTRQRQIFKAARAYSKGIVTPFPATVVVAFFKGAEWADTHQNHWHDAQGDDLPPIDREVIVLLDNGKVCFAHRPNKKGYLGKSMVTGNIETFFPQTYEKGGWNIPNIKWWCDINLPKGGGEE